MKFIRPAINVSLILVGISVLLTAVVATAFGILLLGKAEFEDRVVTKARSMPIEAIGLSIVELNRMKADCESTIPRDQECVALIEFVPTKDRGLYEEAKNL